MSQKSLNELQRQQMIASHVDVKLKTTSARQTVERSFGSVMKSGISATLQTAAGIVSPFSPTASAVLSAAVTQVSGGLQDAGTSGAVAANATTLGAAGTTGGSSGLTGGGALATGTGGTGVSTPNDMVQAQFQLAELNQMFNLQYLGLQQKIQGENRQFTALSNVMKTKHDTAKNALNNLK